MRRVRPRLIVDHQGREVRGNGVSTDIVEAAALAALEVVNRIERMKPDTAAQRGRETA